MGGNFQLNNKTACIGQGANLYQIAKSSMSITNKKMYISA